MDKSPILILVKMRECKGYTPSPNVKEETVMKMIGKRTEVRLKVCTDSFKSCNCLRESRLHA
ncbi:MAG: hypothetical protein DRJ41_00415 [Thermoprotei archaeon]|nr:MAG: hypothetical protein DRJ41_00415 [Thermoprotei archaeon]